MVCISGWKVINVMENQEKLLIKSLEAVGWFIPARSGLVEAGAAEEE